jgi:aryl-alcohol dehydrogenase-like predicted oxidoreductase
MTLPVASLPHRPLGGSGLAVSVLALGSWRTYERIPRAEGAAVLQAARAAGVDLLEVARYNDETGRAPIATGYSEVVFGEVFRASGWPRDEVTIATKLWWEFWPQTPRQELAASLERTGLERFDYVYSDPPPPDLPLEQVVELVAELVEGGLVRAWGIVNWPAARIAEAGRIAAGRGLPPPCCAQLPYSLADRSTVEDPHMEEALDACGAAVVASFVLAGGILTGKYREAGAGGRMAGQLDDPRFASARETAARLVELAAEWETTPAALAVAYALANPRVATVLFGATRPEQVDQNRKAVDLLETLDTVRLRKLTHD